MGKAQFSWCSVAIFYVNYLTFYILILHMLRTPRGVPEVGTDLYHGTSFFDITRRS